jgi:beta-glucosidase
MEQNKMFDMSNLPPFITRDMGPLVYDLSEIEHQFYLFDRRCVGCVVLFCTKPLKPDVVGNISLDGEAISGSFFMEIDVPMQGKIPILAVPIRGKVGYGKEYTLRISGFLDKDGGTIDAVDIPLATKPYPVKNEKYAAHEEIAANAAREGMVLLKNEGNVLPLAPDSALNLFGEGVTNYRIGTTGAGKINPRFAYGLRESIKETTRFSFNPELDTLYTTPANIVPSEEVLLRAKAQNDTAIIILTRGCGENVDSAPLPGEYYLTSDEEHMIEAICRVFDKTVVILNTGYPIDMRWVEKYGIKAVLYTGLAGQASAEVLLEILDGRTNPSGKLPDTWALDYYDIPASVNFYVRKRNEKPILSEDDVWVDTCYEEGIYVGYRYFETFGKEAAYPFGFGLSYTTFTLSDLSCTMLEHNVRISVTVTNTGTASGKEVVQVYAKLPETLQEQPARQLAAFAKTRLLPPGESEPLTLVVDEKSLSTFCVSENAWILEKGGIEFYVGTDVHSAVLCGKITQSETVVLSRSEYRLSPPVSFEEMSPNAKAFPIGGLTRIREDAKGLTDAVCRKEVFPQICITKAAGTLITFGELKANPSLLNSFLAQMSDAELCRLNMMYGHGWGMDGKGEAGRLAPIEKYGIPTYACADGNAV